MISANLSVSGCMLILCSASCCITEIKHYLCTVRNGMHAYVNECLILLLSQYYTFLFFSRSHICFLVHALYIQQKYASTQRPFPCSEIGFKASGFRSIFRVFSPMRLTRRPRSAPGPWRLSAYPEKRPHLQKTVACRSEDLEREPAGRGARSTSSALALLWVREAAPRGPGISCQD